MKKFILISVIFLAYGYCIGQTQPEKPENWTDGTGGNIKNLAELRWLSENEIAWDEEWHLTENIDAAETRNWNFGDHDNNPSTPDSAMGFTPIGTFSVAFSGIFNGNGNTISNIYINRKTGDNAGFFSTVRDGSILNLNLSDFTGYGIFISGLTQQCDNSVIKNCHVSGKISGDNQLGGIAGYNYEGTIKNCTFNGQITGYHTIGGIVGANYRSDILNCKSNALIQGIKEIGGLVGVNSYYTTIENSNSTGKVLATNDDVGGLVGINWPNAKILNCSSSSKVSGYARIGGLVGENHAEVFNSFAKGEVYGSVNTGGLIGNNAAKVRNCYATSFVSGISASGGLIGYNSGLTLIKNCYSSGTVIGYSYTGGFVGVNESDSIMNCFYDHETASLEEAFGIDYYSQMVEGISTDSFINPENFRNWQTLEIPSDSLPWILIKNSRPYLFWQPISIYNSNVKSNIIEGNIVANNVIPENKGFRYKDLNNEVWSYLESSNDLGKISANLEILNIENDILVQGYCSIDSYFYYGDMILFQKTTNLSEISQISENFFFPNPSNGNINLIESNWDFIQIFTLSGQKVVEIKNSNNIKSIDLKSLISGAYVMRVKFLNKQDKISKLILK